MNAVEHLLGRAALERHGARTALVCGGESVSYRELALRVARAAGALRALGAAPGERVLLLMHDTPQFAAAWLGAVHAGAVAVALDLRLSEEDLRYIRADSGARLILRDDRVEGVADSPRSWDDALANAAPPAPPSDMDAEAPAFWLYSSGTTGRPKGIIHPQRSILAAGQGQREVLGLKPGQRVLATSKLFFAYALEHGLLGPIATGATALLNPDWAETGTICDLVAEGRPDAFFSVPTLYRRLLGLGAERLAPFRAVERFIAAGERLPAPLIAQWREATGGEILSLYGMSETFCACMLTPPGTSVASRTGKPLQGVETRLETPEGKPASAGESGVLWIRHPALALGYANRPELTAAQFRDGWFCTRDLFEIDDAGFFLHQGRTDELLKIAGQWVQPAELEETLAGDPAMGEAACVPATDGDGFERLALFVATRGDTEGVLAAARLACEQQIGRAHV